MASDMVRDHGGDIAAMIDQIRAYGLHAPRVLEAMRRVPRHLFIPEECRGPDAYGDHPCPIGHGQTISQPYIVAYMTAALELKEGEHVLEVGTGSGYQAAVLAEMGVTVDSLEVVPEHAVRARDLLAELGYRRVRVHLADGFAGWPDEAPFDAIIVTCAPKSVPRVLEEQLASGGRMIIPVGGMFQRLVRVVRDGKRVLCNDDIGVRFVPMVQGIRK